MVAAVRRVRIELMIRLFANGQICGFKIPKTKVDDGVA